MDKVELRSWCLFLRHALCSYWTWRCSVFTVYAKLKPGFSERLHGQQAGEQPSAACSWYFSLSGIWCCLEGALCSEHLPSGQAGKPLVLVCVTPALLTGYCRLPLHSSQVWSWEGPPGCLKDKITSCVTSRVKNGLNDWLPSRYTPLQFLSQWKTWKRKFDMKLRVITRLRWPADSKVQNRNVASCNVANQPDN